MIRFPTILVDISNQKSDEWHSLKGVLLWLTKTTCYTEQRF